MTRNFESPLLEKIPADEARAFKKKAKTLFDKLAPKPEDKRLLLAYLKIRSNTETSVIENWLFGELIPFSNFPKIVTKVMKELEKDPRILEEFANQLTPKYPTIKTAKTPAKSVVPLKKPPIETPAPPKLISNADFRKLMKRLKQQGKIK